MPQVRCRTASKRSNGSYSMAVAASSSARRRRWPDCPEAECAVAAPYPGIGKPGGLETAHEMVRVDKHHSVAEVSEVEQEARGAV